MLGEKGHDGKGRPAAVEQVQGDTELFSILGSGLPVDPDGKLVLLLVGGAGEGRCGKDRAEEQHSQWGKGTDHQQGSVGDGDNICNRSP
jgi:hypothetical protein